MNVRPYREWTPRIGRGAWIDPAATVIGRVTIGEDASIWPGAVVRGDVNAISIGARTSIQDGSVLHVASSRLAGGDGIPLIVGEECTVGHAVILHACTVGRRCLIGMGAIVMDGAVDRRRGDRRRGRARAGRQGPAAAHALGRQPRAAGARAHAARRSRTSRNPRRTTST